MQLKIILINEIKLIGIKTRMSFANDQTVKLWQTFGPRINDIPNRKSPDLFSVEIYNDKNFFVNFDLQKEYEKWAAVEVEDFKELPDDMKSLTIPQGLYAVFQYNGKPSEAMPVFQYIYGEWLPNSEYEMDNRPYFALMGEKYKGEHEDSEEEFWVPIIKK